MIVPFPIAFLCGALVTDVVHLATAEPFWAYCSFWLVAAGTLTGLVAAVFGMVDFFGDARVRNLAVAKLHFAGNAVVILVSALNAWQRMEDPIAGVAGAGVVLSALAALILLGTGWLGGELAYRYRVGVTGPGAPRG
jgi:uncharacterized membrane protein